MKHITHWINGKPYDGAVERWGPVYNPATGEQTRQVAMATPEQVDLAVQAAKDAFASWREMSLARRSKIMFSFRDLVEEHTEDLAKLLTEEHG
ncbi:MAG: aldehyde dehydrogenase family protein, partial [Acidimicrobiia bacterium]